MVGGGKDREEMRLIDADALMKRKQEEYAYYDIADSQFEDLVNSQPTVFDTEQVIHNLECEKTVWCGRKITTTEVIKIDDAIDIVKKGGVE